jgi:hypothetical protein
MKLRFLLAALLLATGCSRDSATETSAASRPSRPQQAGQPLDPVEVGARVAVAQAAAVTGDRREVGRQVGAIQEDFRRSIRLADPARKVDRESARAAARQVPGVRSVVWIDHENLLAIVSTNQARSQDTIDAICMTLEPLGDTLGVVVNLQSGVATTGDELEVLSRNCQLRPGERALLQRARQVDVVSPAVRAQHRANATMGQLDRSADDAETLRALEAIAPPMQHPDSQASGSR